MLRSSQRWLLRSLSSDLQLNGHWLAIAALLCNIALVGACSALPIAEPITVTATAPTSPTTRATAYVRPTKIPADVLTRALSGMTNLHDAAGLMAALLDVDPEDIRARLITESCALCDMKHGAPYGALVGVSVAEAEAEISDGGTVWLFKGASACEFQLTNGAFSLHKCQ